MGADKKCGLCRQHKVRRSLQKLRQNLRTEWPRRHSDEPRGSRRNLTGYDLAPGARRSWGGSGIHGPSLVAESVDDATLLIQLSQTPTRYSGAGFVGVKLSLSRRGDITGDAAQVAEVVEGIEPAVEADSEFVEVGL